MYNKKINSTTGQTPDEHFISGLPKDDNVIRRIDTIIPIYMRGTALKESDLYKSILVGLNISPPHFPGTAKRLFFSHIPELLKTPLVIIVNAQEMADNALMCIKLMINFDFDSKCCLSFILSGQPELRSRLKLTQFMALTQCIQIFFHMKPMALQETCEYIEHHTKLAGEPTSLFSDSAKKKYINGQKVFLEK